MKGYLNKKNMEYKFKKLGQKLKNHYYTTQNHGKCLTSSHLMMTDLNTKIGFKEMNFT